MCWNKLHLVLHIWNQAFLASIFWTPVNQHLSFRRSQNAEWLPVGMTGRLRVSHPRG